MTKEQSFNVAEKLLLNIYSDDVMICARICTASADKNRDYMTNCLDEVINFCNEIKKAMWETNQ